MARCVVASRGLVHQLLSPTGQWDSQLPRSFEITEQRLHRTLDDMMHEVAKIQMKRAQEDRD